MKKSNQHLAGLKSGLIPAFTLFACMLWLPTCAGEEDGRSNNEPAPRSSAQEETATNREADLESLLCQAIRAGRSEEAIRLLDSGANPDARETAGMPALLLAVHTGDARLLQALLERGANVNETSAGCYSGTHCIKENNALMEAILADRTDIAERLIKAGIDLRHVRADGKNVLHLAARNETAILERMLEGKHSLRPIDEVDQYRRTPLMEAAHSCLEENLSQLLVHGANIEAKDIHGRTALMHVVFGSEKRGNASCKPALQLLLDHGASRLIRDKSNRTAQDHARDQRNSELADLLAP